MSDTFKSKLSLGMGMGLTTLFPAFTEMNPVMANDGKKAEPQKPNVVFFLVDDLGQQDIGCYGSTFYETPHIDAFARTGVKFDNGYAACHVSSPSRACILTGKYPATLHLTDWLKGRKNFDFQRFLNAPINQYLPYSETTLAEVLKENGYKTAIYGKWHLGEDPEGPRLHGFDIHIPTDWMWGWPHGSYYYPFRMKGLDEGSKEGDYLTDRLTDEALKYIEENRNEPFFLMLSHYAVHDPIQGRKDLVEKYGKKLARMKKSDGPAFILEGNPDSPTYETPEEAMRHLDESEYGEYRVLPNQMVKIKQDQDNIQFAAMVEAMDESFGRVMDKLEELDLTGSTIVIFVSDNGGMSAANFGHPNRVIRPDQLDKAYSTSNLPLRGGKGWYYEGGIRVPMIIRWPGHGAEGVSCGVPVIGADFYPTLLEMIGIPVPEGQKVDGVSIVPLVKGRRKLDRDAIYWHFPHYSNHGMQSPGGAIRCGDYKLLEYYENGSVQLFNLKEDFRERRDISRENPRIVKRLLKKLHQWRADVHAAMMEPNPRYNPEAPYNNDAF